MKRIILTMVVFALTGCMRPDHPSVPKQKLTEPGCNIHITQVINSNEVLADVYCYESCKKNSDKTFSCDNQTSHDFGHFTINSKNMVDGDRYHYTSIKRVGVYKYTNTFGAAKTVPDFKAINTDSKLEGENKKLLDEYNVNFPEDERRNYQPIFYFSNDIGFYNLISPVVYTPLSLLFSPLCLFDNECYVTLRNISDKIISTPYKDR